MIFVLSIVSRCARYIQAVESRMLRRLKSSLLDQDYDEAAEAISSPTTSKYLTFVGEHSFYHIVDDV